MSIRRPVALGFALLLSGSTAQAGGPSSVEGLVTFNSDGTETVVHAPTLSGSDTGGITGDLAAPAPTDKAPVMAAPTAAGAPTLSCAKGTYVFGEHCWKCRDGYVPTQTFSMRVDERAKVEGLWSTGWESIDGNKACAKLDPKATDYLTRPATYVQPRCPEGTLFDLIKGGSCYQCPKSKGRSGYPVDGARACGQDLLRGPWSKATFVRSAKCPAGSFLDLQKGGKCWDCRAYKRTLLPIEGPNACRSGTIVLEPAAIAK